MVDIVVGFLMTSNFTSEALIASSQIVKNTSPEILEEQDALGLAVPEKVSRKIANRSLKSNEMKEVVPREGVLVKHPVTDANADDVHKIGSKTLYPMFVESLIELEKVDPEKQRQARNRANQRVKKQKRKEKRKKQEKKKNRNR